MMFKVTKQHVAIKLTKTEWGRLRSLVDLGLADIGDDETYIEYRKDALFGKQLRDIDTTYIPNAATHFRKADK
jgi:hypothetical protein